MSDFVPDSGPDTPAHVDPTSQYHHIVVGVNTLREKTGGAPNEILRGNLVGESASGLRYWFRDNADVRRELGMEEHDG